MILHSATQHGNHSPFGVVVSMLGAPWSIMENMQQPCGFALLHFNSNFTQVTVPKVQIENKWTSDEVMAWYHTSHKPWPKPLEMHDYCAVLRISHDDVIKWKHFLRYWPFVQGIHRSPVNSLHKGQGRDALMFSLICVRINGWVNNCKAGDLRWYRAHYDVIVMNQLCAWWQL